MQKSVLGEIIRSLSKKEVRELHKWLQSPAHNQRQDVVRLFDFMVKSLTNGDESAEKERAWKAVFPKEPYDDAYLRQVMYFLLKAVEEYLVFIDFTNDRVQQQIALTRIYRQRKLEKAYRQSHRLSREALTNQPLRNGYYLLNKFFLEREEYEYKLSITQNAPVNLQEMSDAIEKWFITEKLLIGNAMLAHHKVYQKVTYETGLLDIIMDYVAEHKLLNDVAIASLYYAYMASTNTSEENYFESLEELIHEKSAGLFNTPETRNLYLTALNYCASKVNQGSLEYCSKALKFYRSGVEKGVLLENNVITRYTFGNAVAFALKIGEFGWAEQFIEKFQHHLDDKERNSIVNFNQSRIYFEKGDYSKAQHLLTQFEYDDMLFNLIAKTMLLKIYYETDEYDAFESLLESMRTYLQRKEALDPTRKAAYKNMISLMKKLLSLNIFSKPQKDAFRELIQKTNPLAEREWLLRQIGEK
ncbi:MAG: hypothetical protein SFV22_20465 [Saprospiraceae bacterium]|nr:hypothetical protein [Saprospiraceae bacterium]